MFVTPRKTRLSSFTGRPEMLLEFIAVSCLLHARQEETPEQKQIKLTHDKPSNFAAEKGIYQPLSFPCTQQILTTVGQEPLQTVLPHKNCLSITQNSTPCKMKVRRKHIIAIVRRNHQRLMMKALQSQTGPIKVYYWKIKKNSIALDDPAWLQVVYKTNTITYA